MKVWVRCGNARGIQEVSKGDSYTFVADETSRQVWQEIAENIASEDPQRREDMLHYFHRDGYEARRTTISRALGRLHGHHVSMTDVPERFSALPDGTQLFQYASEEPHIYFAAPVIQRASALGLEALVADGVHDLQPDATNKLGQFYAIHGVLCNDVAVPLLFAITNQRGNGGHLPSGVRCDEGRDGGNGAGAATRLRVILDFERAAINAAQKVFPGPSVEGCAFHLAQAWNRRRDALGLHQYVREDRRCRRVIVRVRTIKGLVFLPPHLHRKVRPCGHSTRSDARMTGAACSLSTCIPTGRPIQGYVVQVERLCAADNKHGEVVQQAAGRHAWGALSTHG